MSISQFRPGVVYSEVHDSAKQLDMIREQDNEAFGTYN